MAMDPEGPAGYVFDEEQEELIFGYGLAVVVLLAPAELTEFLLLWYVRNICIFWSFALDQIEDITRVRTQFGLVAEEPFGQPWPWPWPWPPWPPWLGWHTRTRFTRMWAKIVALLRARFRLYSNRRQGGRSRRRLASSWIRHLDIDLDLDLDVDVDVEVEGTDLRRAVL